MKVSNLSTRLTQAMAWRGMNGDDLARASGVHKSLISRYKNDQKKEPRDTSIEAMANALAVNPLWLRGYDVPPEKNIESQITVSPREKKIIEKLRACDNKTQLKIEKIIDSLTEE